MANVLRPVQRPRKRSYRSWYLFGAVFCGLLSGIVYLFFTDVIDPVQFELTPAKEFPESASQNDRLSQLFQITIDPHRGGESIVYVNGTIYTGTVDGKILRIVNSQVHVFVDLNTPGCGSFLTCGRPLGMRLSLDGQNLLFVDASRGLFSVSLNGGKVNKIFPIDQKFQPTFLNDFDILPDGTIILSETSTKFSLENLFADVAEGRPNGRLLSINPKTGEWKILNDKLHFANGVQLHRDGKSVLVAETTRARVIRVPVTGQGHSTVFVDGLPGLPDNIRASPRGGYWIPVNNVRGNSFIGKFTDWAARWPSVRRLLLRATSLSVFAGLKKTKSAMLVRVNDDGKVVEVWHDPQNKVLNVAEVCEVDDRLLTGSYFLPYIGELKL